jgi:hypothetical protein
MSQVVNMHTSALAFTEELTFLRQQTGQDESTILIQALHLGLNELYCQAVEQQFIDGNFPREKAVELLGTDRVYVIEYAQQALAQDIVQGLSL